MKKTNKRKSNFTIVELLVAMGVFSILMLALMQFFTGAQQIWQKSSARSELFENARIALDLIATDLQSVYYVQDHSPSYQFFAVNNGDTKSPQGYERLAFVTVKSSKPERTPSVSSRIAQVQYLWKKTDDGDGKPKRLLVSNVWDDSSKWRATIPKSAGDVTSFETSVFDGVDSATDVSKEGANVDEFDVLVPYVTDFKVYIYNRDQTELGNIFADGFRMPYMIRIVIKLVNKAAYDKWVASGKSNDNLLTEAEREFTRVIVVDRGQYK